jgi:ABC-type uncharacterized transport system ATPase subunit
VPPPLERLIERARRAREPRRPAPPAVARATAEHVAASTLRANDVTVRFGGLVAVDGVRSAPHGRITGVIGPNGAGKTTLFNACSGLNTPSAGEITLDGRDLARRRPSVRARLGSRPDVPAGDSCASR